MEERELVADLAALLHLSWTERLVEALRGGGGNGSLVDLRTRLVRTLDADNARRFCETVDMLVTQKSESVAVAVLTVLVKLVDTRATSVESPLTRLAAPPITPITAGMRKNRLSAAASVLSPESRRVLDVIRTTPGPAQLLHARTRKQLLPRFPSWVRDRFRQLGLAATSAPSYGLPLVSLPLALQEDVLVEDLLFSMQGLPSRVIKAETETDGSRRFTLDPSLDPSVAHVALRILPLCVHYVRVHTYVEQHSDFDSGAVVHAFCGAIRHILKEYLILLSQLEHQQRTGRLSLQKLWFYIQSSRGILEALSTITGEATKRRLRGGPLLNYLHYSLQTKSGDRPIKTLHVYLIRSASVPYFEVLRRWIYRGFIHDPFGEFLVEEHGEQKKERLTQEYNESYWEERYTLSLDKAPAFLAKVADLILTTGKFLNVVRECGREVVCPFDDVIVYTPSERAYVEKIEKAHQFASQRVLDLLIQEKQLLGRLRSIKHYFLLDHGDFWVHFMDTAAEELQKPVADISMTKLESLLELSLRTSSCNTDPFKDDLTCSIIQENRINELLRTISEVDLEKTHRPSQDISSPSVTGLEGFTFAYDVRFPLSLVLSKKALTKYQLILRHLFHFKFVERQLCGAWLNHQTTKAYGSRAAFMSSYCLRQRMLHFLQNFAYYMTVEVLEPNWHVLEERLRSVTTVDEVLRYHTRFLDTTLRQCQLLNPQVLKLITRILTLCTIFARYTEKLANSLVLEEEDGPLRQGRLALQVREARIRVASENFKEIVENTSNARQVDGMNKVFHQLLKLLIDALRGYARSDPDLSNLVARLDYNEYYSHQSV